MKKKSTKILALLLVCVLLMGTGYAYWTDSLNITTTATTGNLDVTFVDFGYYAQYDDEKGWSIIDGITADGKQGYVNALNFVEKPNDYNNPGDVGKTFYGGRQLGYNKVTFDGELVGAMPIKINLPDKTYETKDTKGSDKIQISIDAIYPGYAQAFRTDIVNNGNLAAKLSNIKIDTKSANSQDIISKIGIALYISGEEGFKSLDNNIFKLSNLLQLQDKDMFTMGNVNFVRLSAIDPALFDNIQETLLCIPSSNRMDLYLGVAMDPLAENNTMNSNVEFTVDLDWTQFNADFNVNSEKIPANILKNQNKQ